MISTTQTVDGVSLEQGRVHLETMINAEMALFKEARAEKIDQEARKPRTGWRGWRYSEVQRQLAAAESELKRKYNLIYIREDHPDIIGRGENQLVIEVGNDLVAKAPYLTHQQGSVRLGNLVKYIEETATKLRELGLVVPEVTGYHMHWGLDDWGGERIIVSPNVTPFEIGRWPPHDPRPVNVYLTPDLREGGRFKVHEYDEAIARRLVNGEGLVAQFQEGFDMLLGRVVSRREHEETARCGEETRVSYSPHRVDETHEGAVRKIFQLQVPVDGRKGKLVAGDIDHVQAA